MRSRVIGEASRRNPAMSAGQSGALPVIARLHHPEHSEGGCLGQEPSVADPHARMPSPRPRRLGASRLVTPVVKLGAGWGGMMAWAAGRQRSSAESRLVGLELSQGNAHLGQN